MESQENAGHVHVVPLRVLVTVWAALMVLTVVTVAATWVDLGKLNLWLALAIATLKASLVVLYFMHMRYDQPFNAIVFIGALLFVMLFVVFALMDTKAYQPELIPGYAPGMGTRP
ncbi:MAG: cytochrome C oxidase subunit IV family protein [Thermoanaerobaculum sp.]|nr:cytochrome C oxidase subunit IV family protein [Thermoanaerobaculum sp.]MDW7966560.1 cytochrome C oxidase subunit IV family protein [Thermoanaerobaculum sp.]